VSEPPFGALAPSPAQERIRALAARLPPNYIGRRAASLLLGPGGGRARRAYDVSVFRTQRARLHPFDNICEKRVYLTPQLWDGAERAALADFVASFAGREFCFVDAGANVGLYTLFARSEAQRIGADFRALCIEADPEMRVRLAFNVAASSAGSDVAVAPFAISDREGALRFAVNRESRGESRLDAAGALEVETRPLLSIVADAGLRAIDAMKMDIEGAERAALAAFFANAPAGLRPRFLILEVSHEAAESSALAVCVEAGYAVRLKTRMNAVLAARP
jgi:FkbM family methyltransferase